MGEQGIVLLEKELNEVITSTGPYAGFSEGWFEMERKVTKH